MRKQITRIVTLMLLMTTLAGCGSSATDNAKETTDGIVSDDVMIDEAEEEPVEVKTEEETAEEEPVEVEAEEEKLLSVPQLSYTTATIQGYTVEGVSLYVDYVIPAVEDGDHDLLAVALACWAEQQLTELQEHLDDYAEYTPEAYGADEDFCYTISQTISATYISSKVVSLCRDGYDYLGGTHPNTSQTGVNFDAISGEQLSLSDFLEDADGFYPAAFRYVMDDLEANHGGEMFDDYVQTVEAALQGDANFYLDAQGICLIFDTYELGPYAMGAVEIVLSYEEFGSYLKAAYFE